MFQRRPKYCFLSFCLYLCSIPPRYFSSSNSLTFLVPFSSFLSFYIYSSIHSVTLFPNCGHMCNLCYFVSSRFFYVRLRFLFLLWTLSACVTLSVFRLTFVLHVIFCFALFFFVSDFRFLFFVSLCIEKKPKIKRLHGKCPKAVIKSSSMSIHITRSLQSKAQLRYGYFSFPSLFLGPLLLHYYTSE